MLFLNTAAKLPPLVNRMYFAWTGPLGSGLCPHESEASSPAMMFCDVQLPRLYPFERVAASVWWSAGLVVAVGSALSVATRVAAKLLMASPAVATRSWLAR